MVAWTEVRSAYMVAKLGTVSAAADALGVHRATILRHIDALETELGSKLFQRHQRGYTPTDVGRELLEVGSRADDELTQWLGRARHRQDEPAGELIITALPGFEVTLLRAMIRMQRDFPAVSCRVVTTEQLMRMEFGEAHVALRAGPRPGDPDFVVLHHSSHSLGLYAHRSYVQQHGLPASDADFGQHRFCAGGEVSERVGPLEWIERNVPPESIVLRTDSLLIGHSAVVQGHCIGPLWQAVAEQDDDLVEVVAPHPDWSIDFWIVTHVDLHRTTKVQSFVHRLKETELDLGLAHRHWPTP